MNIETHFLSILPFKFVGDSSDILFGLFSMMWLFMMGLIVALIIFWIFMIIDCVKRDFPGDSDKTLWILILVLAGYIGAIIYYVVIKRKQDSASHHSSQTSSSNQNTKKTT